MLSPYIAPVEIDGTGRKLLAIYMVGSDLEENPRHPAGTNDFGELIAGYNNLPDKNEVEVIVAFGGADKDGWHGMKFANMSQIVGDAEDGAFGNETRPDAYLYRADYANMDDESSLKLFLDYLRDGYANFDQRFLTLWDHGGSYKGFGGDSNFHPDILLLDEITRAFEHSQIGVFDLIGFDACNMASVEVAKIIEPHADYMIASEELEPGHGWLWSEVIRSYAEEDNIVETGKRMVDNFVQNVHVYEDKGKTLSLLDLSEYDRLEAALNPVISAYGQRILSNREYASSLVSASTQTRSYGESKRDGTPPISIDLKHFAQLLLANLPPDAEAAPHLNELIDAVDSFVVHSKHDGSRPNSYGIAIDKPENTGGEYAKYADYKVNDTWRDFQNTFLTYRQTDTEPPELTASDGLTVVFEDENLAGVTALYGFEETVGPDDYFMVVAELDAYPTGNEGEYFADVWDQWWFTVEYDSSEITAWIPASFADRFTDEDGREYMTYASEIDYYRAGDSVGDLAVMTLLVDENMQVIDHQIQTYQHIYTSPEDETGSIRFDKATFRIELGDAVQFWNWGFHLQDQSLDGWFEASGVVEFVQAPDFRLEFLKFDQFGQPIEYQQGMWAEDASGNGEFYQILPPDESLFAVFEDPSGYFRAHAPAAWQQAQLDAYIGEVFSAYDPNGSGEVSIRAYREIYPGDAPSLSDSADALEAALRRQGAEGVWRTISETEQGNPAVMFEYGIGDVAYVQMVYPLGNGAFVDVLYSFIPGDAGALEAEEFYWLAYSAFAAFWIY